MALRTHELSAPALHITWLSPSWLRLEGEVDISNHEELVEALSPLLDEEGDVHLDLAGLGFISVRATGSLVTLAGWLQPHRRLILHDPPHGLERVILIGWGDAPGLEVA
ncbi:MAG: STAS domain-containing protein [Acidimicrobiales bacterium]